MAEVVVDGAPARADRTSAPFWTYWTATTISGLGDAVTAVALPLTAVQVLHATAFEVSAITAAGFAAWALIGLPAGVVVQRLPLAGTQTAMDLVRAVALLSVPVAAALHQLHVGQLVAVAFAVGLASVVFDVGNASLLPEIVSPDELTARNSLVSGTQASTQLGGPSLGGVLVQVFGAVASLVADVVSYVVSAALLRRLARPPRATAAAEREPMLASIRAGWRFVTGHEVMRACVLGATAVNFVCGGLMALTPVFLVRTLHAQAGLVGLLVATEGLGSLVGATLTPRLARAVGTARATLLAGTAGAVAAWLMPLSTGGPGLLLFGFGNAGFAAGVVVMSVLWRTHRQTVTPPALLPRVMATVRFISWGVIPIGALTAGACAALVGNRCALGVMCALAVVAPLALCASEVRVRRDLAE